MALIRTKRDPLLAGVRELSIRREPDLPELQSEVVVLNSANVLVFCRPLVAKIC